jgi:hypothetical protein
VFDPAFDDALTYAKYPDSLIAPIPLSDPSRILPDAPSPTLPDPPFIKEPPHAWCYYYEKAELARQTGDWAKIVALGLEAKQKNFTPQDALEWLPFIEADARTGAWSQAEAFARQALHDDPKIQRVLCLLFKRVRAGNANLPVSNLLPAFNCNQ